jgi:uncharacterized delta-60 repeat protein
MLKNKGALSFLLAGFALAASHAAFASAPGALDPGFSGDGKVTASFPGAAQSVVNRVKQQPTGKLAVAGYQRDASLDLSMTVARFNSNGSLDTDFSGDGMRAITFTGGESIGWSLANSPNDKTVVAGSVINSGNWDFALARLTDSGALDTGFGTGGLVSTAIGSGNNEALDVFVHSDGRIKAAGYSNSGGTNYRDFAMAAYNAAGALDITFGSGGKVTTNIGGDDIAFIMLQQPDNKFVVAGYSTVVATGIRSFAIARYSATGSLDTGFSSDGKLTTTFPNNVSSEIYGITRQRDGKLVAVGCAGPDIALARYTNSGALDTGFGTNGLVVTNYNTGDDCGYSVIQQFDGKLLVSGYARNGSVDDFVLVRYNSNGTLDTDFGTAGKLATSMGGSAGALSAIEQLDGQVVAAGVSGTQMALVRYLFDDDDGDTIVDNLDNCQYVPNTDQANNDAADEPLNAQVGDVCDDDDDNDDVKDVDDVFPFDPAESVDTDGDGTGNNADTDDDNDGVPDVDDPFPLDPFLLNRVTGDSKTDYAGYSVAIVGDVNADGFADILVGVPKNDVILPLAAKAAVDVGTAYLVSGAMPGGVQVILETFDGAAKGDEFGGTVAAVGDVNHDTVPDFAITAPKADQLDPLTGKVLIKDRGAVTVYSGANFSVLFTLTGEAAGDGFGISVAAAGDADADTYGDIVVGAWKADGIDSLTLKPIKDAGAAYLYSGQTGNLLHKFPGEAKGDYFGYSVAAGSDMDGDAVSEISIGAYKHDPLDGITNKPRIDAGSVYVYNSASPYTLVKRLDGVSKGDNFGFAQVAIIAEYGYRALIVGAPRADVVAGKSYADAGQVSLHIGPMGIPAYTMHGVTPQAGARFGSALSVAGDVDGDGLIAEDFIVGAPKTDIILGGKKLIDAGQISVHNANGFGLIFSIDGDIKGGQFGFAVAGAGDHNNDGYDDVMTGAPYATFDGKTKAGVAKVISGKEASDAAAP